ncbi:hypothetical protein [Leptolyngbya sp. FACHB-17]|nr:hypothetical protein [Leptolyngbya sp. FACHB-17]MBD2082630.1 hypothetical protein [Leptolyngbya sp. FACHB-17]
MDIQIGYTYSSAIAQSKPLKFFELKRDLIIRIGGKQQEVKPLDLRW